MCSYNDTSIACCHFTHRSIPFWIPYRSELLFKNYHLVNIGKPVYIVLNPWLSKSLLGIWETLQILVLYFMLPLVGGGGAIIISFYLNFRTVIFDQWHHLTNTIAQFNNKYNQLHSQYQTLFCKKWICHRSLV